MKVKMMILLFAILALSSLKQGSAHVPDRTIHQENVAVRGKATQSSQHTGGGLYHAINAIDGNRDPNFHHGSCVRTTHEANPWWRVDLLQMYTITSVTISNLGLCGGNKIWGARILIGNSLENNGINNPQCSVIKSLPTGGTKTFHCPQPMFGRYVTVYLPKTEYLHFCEVEVNALIPAP